MSINIYDIANELERAIRHLPEYKAAEVAKVAVESNPEAKKIFDAYMDYQKDIQAKLQSGQMLEDDVQAKMQDFSRQVQGNPILTDYFTKQQQLSLYISDLEKLIFKPLQDLL
ncbi:YlbF/YmcA family competence regulator [Streptococcus gallolyticus]|uniref:YlbF/YmcA family competence regulator n=1 Tax=Streptococcus hepaticus TaxID=3349163 RepID=UPI001C956628|nr:YlbF/YmcA family competence regulator [Streptococcus gallolyticus]MBY5041067.1 YlbF/YmcA family competence regulator [Streptococcus gallolyticus]